MAPSLFEKAKSKARRLLHATPQESTSVPSPPTPSPTPSQSASEPATRPTSQPTPSLISTDSETSPLPNLQERLWNQAYDNLKAGEPKLVDAFEKILSVGLHRNDPSSVTCESTENEIGGARETRCRQMQQLVQNGLDRTQKVVSIKQRIDEGLEAVQTVREIVNKAVQAAPEAAVVWVGVCLGLEILSNPATEARDNRKGIAYVLSRIEWYWNLVSLLLDENKAEQSSAGLRAQLEKHIVQLYEKLLSYQMKSVCLYHRNWAAVIGRDILKIDDWAGQLSEIQESEAAVHRDMEQYNTEESKMQLRKLAAVARSQEMKLQGIHLAIQDQTRQQKKIKDDTWPKFEDDTWLKFVDDTCWPKFEDDTRLRFACPYHQYDPKTFGAKRTCCGPGWTELPRVKEHLERSHSLPKFQCNRCCRRFKKDEELKKHQRETTPCPVKDPSKIPRDLADGYDEEQAKKLKARIRKAPDDKWKEWYCILFDVKPDSPYIPSPYHGPFNYEPHSLFNYKPLRHEKQEIRLLTLDPPASDSTTLKCTLWHVPLPKAPPYIALSYHWGDPAITADIAVNGVKHPVTANLEAALRRLRAAEAYTIWADALCINQMDTNEKSLQVPRIGTIFRKASEVAIWLGDELDIDEISREHLCAGTAPELDRDTCLSTLPVFKHLLGRPYWRRVWIIQELAFASCISLYCGRFRIPWQTIDANCNCCQSGNFINARGRPADENVCRFTMLRGVRAHVLARQPIRLLDVLHRTRSSLATDPRDKIYALLGLTYDGQHFVPEPSYMSSMSDTFTEFATSLLTNNEPLDFIYLRSANRKVGGELPSWVPDWTDLNDPVAHRQFDCIMPHSPHIAKSPEAHEVPSITISGSELNVKGVLFDTVNGLGSALTSEDEDTFAHETAFPDEPANPYRTEDEISHIVYRTLASSELFPTAQYNTLDGMPPDFYHIWRMRSVQQLEEVMPTIVPHNLSNSLWTWLAENRSFMVHGQTIEWWTKTWSKLSSGKHSVQNEHQFFYTVRSCMRVLMTERGYLGWAHPQTRKGDKIAILFGCKRPVILRPYQGGYHIVGDACLSGRSIGDLRKAIVNDEVENVRIL